ncbi:hypothetical protein [Laspinema olomoucense]|uniref:Uncharacterized protein n=1 Tax=Laspinema olomoucense D3b TaxID=2953688 RepID=A0ABT2N4L0_9CYAN|nr:hypothetical protein [Laspinema sp. D3b]MCT7977623.1 hypothetical protein [Laspinema sp. D3b]
MDNKKYNYFLFPPFIDAYKTSESDSPRTLTEIQSFAEQFATEWGESVIAYSVFKNKPIPRHNNQIILCCVFIYKGSKPDNQYLLVTDGDTDTNYWWQNFHFVQGQIQTEWNVT